MTSLGNGTWFNGFNNFLSPDLTFARYALRGLVPVVDRVQSWLCFKELLHFEQVLWLNLRRQNRLMCKRVGHSACAGMIAGWVMQSVLNNLVFDTQFVVVLFLAICRHFSVEVAKDGLDGSAGSEWQPIGVLRVGTNHLRNWRWLDEPGETARCG